jgi:predicted nucleic acid-binding protein
MKWLLDTNVLSETIRPGPSPAMIRFLADAYSRDLFLSTVNLAEIRFGIGRTVDSIRRHQLEQWLEHDLRINFAGRILELTEDIMVDARRRTQIRQDAFPARPADRRDRD